VKFEIYNLKSNKENSNISNLKHFKLNIDFKFRIYNFKLLGGMVYEK